MVMILCVIKVENHLVVVCPVPSMRIYESSKNSGWLLKRSLHNWKKQNFIVFDRTNIFVLDVLKERITHL